MVRVTPLDVTQALRAEILLRPTYFGTRNEFERAITLIADGTIPAELLLTSYPLVDAIHAFADAGAQRVLKPLIRPTPLTDPLPRGAPHE